MRYFAGLLAIIAFIVLVIVVVTHHGPKTATTKTTTGTKAIVLTDYANKNSEVHLYTDGQINASDTHRAVEVIVSPTQRKLTVYQGYNLSVFRQQSYPNDPAAYDTFLHALSLLNFTRARTGVRLTDERGVCPTGDRYIYELRENGKDVTRLWSTSCNSGQGTFAGIAFTVRSLFQKQIPDYNSLVQNVAL